MDRFSELSAFAKVVEEGSFSAAARQLGQSRSSVNRLVIALEQRLGVQLLHRTTRSVSVTGVGRAVYERAQFLLTDLEELEQSAQSSGVEPFGKLRLSAPPTFQRPDFAEIVVGFMQRYPKVEIDARFDTRVVDPVAEGYDVVIRVAPPDEETTLVDHRVMTIEYALCASPDYLDRWGTPALLHEVSDHAVLFQGTATATPRWALLVGEEKVSVPVRPVLYSNDLGTIYRAACTGLGIAILPLHAIQTDLEARGLRQILPEVCAAPRVLQVIHPPARYLSAKVRLFVDFVADYCAEIDIRSRR